MNVPFSTHYSKEHNFMLTKASGDLSDSDLIQHIISLNAKTENLLILKELSDCREVKSVASLSTETATLAAKIEQKKSASRLAILIPKDNKAAYGLARAYQMFSEEKREAVSIFHNLDEALVWLTEDNTEEKEALFSFMNNT